MLPNAEFVKERLQQLLGMKAKMAKVMQPEQYAKLCADIDASLANLKEQIGGFEIPELPLDGLNDPKLNEFPLTEEATGLIDQAKNEPKAITELRKLIADVKAMELDTLKGPATRDWTEAFVKAADAKPEPKEEEEIQDWVYASLSVGLPPGMSIIESEQTPLRQVDAGVVSAETGETTAKPPTEKTDEKKREQFSNFQSWVANSLSGVPERSQGGEPGADSQWDHWLRG